MRTHRPVLSSEVKEWEALREAGLSYYKIGQIFNRSDRTIRVYLEPEQMEIERTRNRERYQFGTEAYRETHRARARAYSKRIRENGRD